MTTLLSLLLVIQKRNDTDGKLRMNLYSFIDSVSEVLEYRRSRHASNNFVKNQKQISE